VFRTMKKFRRAAGTTAVLAAVAVVALTADACNTPPARDRARRTQPVEVDFSPDGVTAYHILSLAWPFSCPDRVSPTYR